MALKLSNNSTAQLAAVVVPTGTVVSLNPGQGEEFPVLSPGDWFPGTLISVDNKIEIVKITDRTGDTLTVVRAQEGTSAKTFNPGDRIELRLTAGALQSILDTLTQKMDTASSGYVRGAGGVLQLSISAGKYQLSHEGSAADNIATESFVEAAIPTGAEAGFWGIVAPAGWVLASGRTIGNSASGGTERSHADTEALFTLLWNGTTNAVLQLQDATGAAVARGASAAADFAANRRLSLPDMRGRTGAGLDNMGGTVANRLTAGGSGIAGTTLGASGGAETHTLTTPQIPTHNHGVTDPGHAHQTYVRLGQSYSGLNYPAGGSADNATYFATVGSATTGISIQNNGGGGVHNNTQPTIMRNVIIKL